LKNGEGFVREGGSGGGQKTGREIRLGRRDDLTKKATKLGKRGKSQLNFRLKKGEHGRGPRLLGWGLQIGSRVIKNRQGGWGKQITQTTWKKRGRRGGGEDGGRENN